MPLYTPHAASVVAARVCIAAEAVLSLRAVKRRQRNSTPYWLGSVVELNTVASPSGSSCATVPFHCHMSNCASWLASHAEDLQSTGAFVGIPQPVWYGLVWLTAGLAPSFSSIRSSRSDAICAAVLRAALLRVSLRVRICMPAMASSPKATMNKATSASSNDAPR